MGIKAVKLYFRGIFLLISVAALILAILLNSAGNTSPASTLWLQYLSVLSPFLIILNISLLVYWSFRKSLLLLIPLASLIINFTQLKSLFNFSLSDNYPTEETLTICTYNINYFSNSEYSNVPQIARAMSGYGVEILALQEFKPTGFYNIDEIAGEFRFMSYNSIYNEDEEAIGMALFSKYPVLRSNKIKFENTGNGAMWADILYKGDTIRVINNHLQTTGYYSSYPKGLKYLVDIISQNFIVRSEQAGIIRELIDTTSYPVIVMGDFNDTPNSFVYSTIKGDDLKDGFVEKGSGPGGTFRRTMGLLRIDMIFHSKHFESAGFTIGSDKLSDHKPVISVLEYKN